MKEVMRYKLGEDEMSVVELATMKMAELQRVQSEVANRCLKVVAKLLGLKPDLQHHILKQEGEEFFLVVQEEETDLPDLDM